MFEEGSLCSVSTEAEGWTLGPYGLRSERREVSGNQGFSVFAFDLRSPTFGGEAFGGSEAGEFVGEMLSRKISDDESPG